MARKTMGTSPFPRIRPDSPILPNESDEVSEPWDIAIGHANVPEDMGSPLGLSHPDPHNTHVGDHSVSQYASYVDEDVRNPEGAS